MKQGGLAIRIQGLLPLLAGSALLCACSASEPIPVASPAPGRPAYTEVREPCASFHPLRDLYFGDLHAHTGLSHETWILDVTGRTATAHAFARGESIGLPPLDADGRPTRTLRLDRPLDFAAVTDHGEFLAEVEACVVPGTPAYDSRTCEIYREKSFLSELVVAFPTFTPNPRRSQDICGPAGTDCPALAERVWAEIRRDAEEAYDRTSACTFTSFVAYEYTGLPGATNLHRNVIFRNGRLPDLPVSYFEEQTPAGLWTELERVCLEEIEGCDVLAIPHNSNESNGTKFTPVYPGAGVPAEERKMAALRARLEPVAEIFQHKGDSECMNGLQGVRAPPDPLCSFEKIRRPPFEDCGDGTGLGGLIGGGCVSRRDYLRYALLEGLKEEARIGVNPFKLGFIASTDTHNATPGAVAERDYVGHWGIKEDTPEERLGKGAITHQGLIANPGGLSAVWAVENSRDAIFDALRRRETFGTSGPRLSVRVFGGWDLPDGMCGRPDTAPAVGYRHGVPMGGDLPPRSSATARPRFYVRAIRAQGSGGRAGTPLQRIQIIKGWVGPDLEPGTRVYEVAGDPHNGAGVDPETCEPRGHGFETLCTLWTDPDFRPDERAYYYARVLENPTCRWSAWECTRLPAGRRPPACSDPAVPTVIQERAWTSPIWYTP